VFRRKLSQLTTRIIVAGATPPLQRLSEDTCRQRASPLASSNPCVVAV
jgi:hypothetical protein